MKQKGMFWHVHHDRLLEYCYSYDERVVYIEEHKPADEVETRLRLFKPVKGKLPEAVIKAFVACDKAYVARDKADAACDKAYVARDKAYVAYDKAYAAWLKANAAWLKADVACRKAYVARVKADAACRKAIQDNMVEIEALHTKECLDCPWNGTEIVF